MQKMFTTQIPTYVINLEQDESCRWNEVIDAELPAATRVIEEALSDLKRVPEFVRWIFGWLYRRSGGRYQGEIKSWAKALNISVGTMTVLNCLYELSHLRLPRPFGCTAGVRWVENLGMVHVRSLDWPLATIGNATRLFHFRDGRREFVSVGVPGYTGVLSGMLPNAYSVTINWAPPSAFPSFAFGPAFLLREVLETCDSYSAAVRVLSETPLATSVFFTVCGTKQDQACVVERTKKRAVIRRLSKTALVQANHHVTGIFKAKNRDIAEPDEEESVFTLDGSRQRADSLCEALSDLPDSCSISQLRNTLNKEMILNQDTCQQMVFCPTQGKVKIWRMAN